MRYGCVDMMGLVSTHELVCVEPSGRTQGLCGRQTYSHEAQVCAFGL